jgi:hypothetical protein
MCLLIKSQDFLAGLSKSLPFEIIDTSVFDPHPWRKSLMLEESIHYLSHPNSKVGSDRMLRISLKHQDSSATLWLIDDMQHIFQLTQDKTYLLANIAFDAQKSLNYLPYNATITALIARIANHFKAYYGWMEPDFYGTPDEYSIWHLSSHFPTQVYPWTYPSQSRFLNLDMLIHLGNHHIDTEILGHHGITLSNGVLLTPKSNLDADSGSFPNKERKEFDMLLSLVSSHLEIYQPV